MIFLIKKVGMSKVKYEFCILNKTYRNEKV